MLTNTIHEMRKEHKQEIIQLEAKILSISEELETTRLGVFLFCSSQLRGIIEYQRHVLRAKWQASITNKRAQRNAKFNTSGMSQHPRERQQGRRTASATDSISVTHSHASAASSMASSALNTPRSTSPGLCRVQILCDTQRGVLTHAESRAGIKRAPGSASSAGSSVSMRSGRVSKHRCCSIHVYQWYNDVMQSDSLSQRTGKTSASNSSKGREILKPVNNKPGLAKKKRKTDKTVPVASRFLQEKPKFR